MKNTTIILALVLAYPALAQSPRTDQPSPERLLVQRCKDDYGKFCAGGTTASAALQRACLMQYYLNLSPGCKTAIRSMGQTQQDNADQGD
jgi:hypothetical protein